MLLGLNGLAVFVLFMSWMNGGGGGAAYDRGWQDCYNEVVGTSGDGGPVDEQAGIYAGGRTVTNIYPYDTSGKPLTGLQLFDQDGKPIDVAARPDCTSTVADPLPPTVADEDGIISEMCLDERTGEPVQPRIFYPWSNGAAQFYNVFPLPSRAQPDTALDPNAFANGGTDAPKIQEPPLATVPKVSLPGIAASSPSASPSVSPTDSPSASPSAPETP